MNLDRFLNYLENEEENSQNIQETKKEVKKPKVLCMNVEVRTIEGAKTVIEKLQNWIAEQEKLNGKKFVQESKKSEVKKYKIPEKKVIKNKFFETRSHAMNILDGMNDEVVINEELHQSLNINNKPQFNQPNIDTVAGHASALL